ncbi:MAG: TatD family hydrolase [Rubrivivax sp.]|nr:TatD family hydrolase [Rubrivivax sp.]
MFVDSHCHLSFPELLPRVGEILEAMGHAQVERALCICTTLEEAETVIALAARDERLFATVGVHPDTEGLREPTVADLVALARRPRVVGIGETGLDYYRLNGRSIVDMQWQRDRFAVHIRAALATGLPLVVHTRSASDDTLALLREHGAEQGALRGVFHCFTETHAVALAALEMGFHISFSGILSFRNAQALRDVAREVPLERCLVETDSPYLAPAPYRGKTNTPALVPHVAQALAAAKGLTLEEVAAATRGNFERLFGLPPGSTLPATVAAP